MLSKPIYTIVVGNIGTVYTGTSRYVALKEFADWVSAGVNFEGRAGGEPVTLFKDGEPILEHKGHDVEGE